MIINIFLSPPLARETGWAGVWGGSMFDSRFVVSCGACPGLGRIGVRN